eukprot:1334435-Amorphochlora_amoeboformis.AAC.2
MTPAHTEYEVRVRRNHAKVRPKIRVGVRLNFRVDVGFGSDYSGCLSPRTIDSSNWGAVVLFRITCRVRVRVRVKAGVTVKGYTIERIARSIDFGL